MKNIDFKRFFKHLSQNKELVRRLFFTLFVLFLIRCLTKISVPWIDVGYVRSIFTGSTAFNFYNAITGGGLENFSIFSLSISPYITASILVQLATIVFPSFEELQKSGEYGRQKLSKKTHKLSIILSFFQAWIVAMTFSQSGMVIQGSFPVLVITLTLVAGSSLLVWLGNKITEFGIGNGISLILLLNILSRLPKDAISLYQLFVSGGDWKSVVSTFIISAIVILIVVLTIMLNEAVYKIPVQYASRLGGKRANVEYIPLKLNIGNIMPVIFASSILSVPSAIIETFNIQLNGVWKSLYLSTIQDNWFNLHSWKLSIGYVVYVGLLVFFAYFYGDIAFNSEEVADNLKRSNATIPSIRPGKPTDIYIKNIVSPLILVGSIALAALCTIPMVLSGLFEANVSFAGVSVIIATSVFYETYKYVKIYI